MESFSKLNDVVPLTPYSAAMFMRFSAGGAEGEGESAGDIILIDCLVVDF